MRKNQILHLPPLWLERWHHHDPFWQVSHLTGEVFREQPGRKTLRFIEANEPYFIKYHYGVGWKEIFKNLSQGRLPILGAKNEYLAIQRLAKYGFVPKVIGYGWKGKNPAKQHSFLITKELSFTVSLEDFCRPWLIKPPSVALKRGLIRKVADIARKMHASGVNHRDFYLCHFLLDITGGSELLQSDALNLYLIDLHRAQLRHHVPFRWRVKDIAGLYFSAMEIGLTRNDLRCFALAYNRGKNPLFWQAVERQALALYRKIRRKLPLDFRTPFSLPLKNGDILQAQRIIRRLPKKRLVIQGQWKNKMVLAKLFTKKRYALAELHGYQQLARHSFDTPTLYHHGWSQHQALYVVIYHYEQDAITFATAFNTADDKHKKYWLAKLVDVVKAQHQSGLWQRDLHFDNFLVVKDKILTIDVASIHAQPQLLSAKQHIANMAQLFIQLPDGLMHLIEEYLTPDLQQAMIDAQHKRVHKYLLKTQRNCSAFRHKKTNQYELLIDRRYDNTEFQQVIADLLKHGIKHSTFRINQEEFIIKAFTAKNLQDLKITPARQLWLQYHQQCFTQQHADILPITLIEKRRLYLKTVSYLIIKDKC